MEHNEGREPTEPTDARCKARRRGRFERCELEAGHEYGHRAGSWGWVSVEDTVSGARPMPGSEVSRAEVLRMSTDTLLKAEAERLPDTPAPDEVAQLRAEVARLKDALIDREIERNQLLAGMQEELTAQRLLERCGCLYLGNGVEVAISGTTARVAELEAELAAVKAELDTIHVIRVVTVP